MTVRSREDRGVSEVIGFLLIFTILLTVSIAGAIVGIESIQQAGDGEAIHAAQTSMERLGGTLHDISGGATYRTVSIETSDGTISLEEPIRLTIEGQSDAGSMEPIVVRPQPIRYEHGPGRLVIELGAVILEQEDGAVMKAAPVVRIDPRQTIVTVVETSRAGGPTSIGASGRSNPSVAVLGGNRTVHRYEPTDAEGNAIQTTVIMTITSPRTGPWQRYFEAHPRFGNVTVEPEANRVSAQFVTERLYVKVTAVDVRLSA